MTSVPVYVAVVGSGEADAGLYEKARRVGRLVAERGGIVVCGGLGGVMEAAARGATEAAGTAVGILPDENRGRANPYLTYSLVHLQDRFRFVSYISSHENSNLCTAVFGRGAQTA